MAMEHDRTIVLHDPDLHGAGMQVDPTGKGVLGSVTSPEVSSASVSDFSLSSAYPSGMLRGEASIIINALQLKAGVRRQGRRRKKPQKTLCGCLVRADTSCVRM